MKQSVSWKQLRGKHPSFDLLPWEVKDTLASKFRRSKMLTYTNIALRSCREPSDVCGLVTVVAS